MNEKESWGDLMRLGTYAPQFLNKVAETLKLPQFENVEQTNSAALQWIISLTICFSVTILTLFGILIRPSSWLHWVTVWLAVHILTAVVQTGIKSKHLVFSGYALY